MGRMGGRWACAACSAIPAAGSETSKARGLRVELAGRSRQPTGCKSEPSRPTAAGIASALR
eukprot:5303817-Alexandrium_andersonii.AAC.1